MVIDSHCHLDDPDLAGELDSALELALQAGVSGAIVPSYGPERWSRQTELLLKPRPFSLWGAFGLHPWTLEPDGTLASYQRAMETGWHSYARHWGKKLVAVGEFGLDRSRRRRAVPLDLQQEVFQLHLEWARRLDLPVILHLVKADGAAFSLLGKAALPRAGVIHGFSSHAETVARYTEHGFSLSYGAGLLASDKAREALRVTPLDRMLFETDAPGPLAQFENPKGPHHLIKIVETASQVLAKSVEYLLAQHTENCARVFGLRPG